MQDSLDYQLLRKLGADAFGEVWHAHGPGGIEVALKFVCWRARVFAGDVRSQKKRRILKNLKSQFATSSSGWKAAN